MNYETHRFFMQDATLWEDIQEMGEHDRARLCTAIFETAYRGDTSESLSTDTSDPLHFLFSRVRRMMEQNDEHYAEVRETKRHNGQLGGIAKSEHASHGKGTSSGC